MTLLHSGIIKSGHGLSGSLQPQPPSMPFHSQSTRRRSRALRRHGLGLRGGIEAGWIGGGMGRREDIRIQPIRFARGSQRHRRAFRRLPQPYGGLQTGNVIGRDKIREGQAPSGTARGKAMGSGLDFSDPGSEHLGPIPASMEPLGAFRYDLSGVGPAAGPAHPIAVQAQQAISGLASPSGRFGSRPSIRTRACHAPKPRSQSSARGKRARAGP